MEGTERCVFRPCPKPVVVSLRLRVDGRETVLPTCLGHADWLGAYADEDRNVRFEDTDSAGSRLSLPVKDAGTPA